MVTQTRLIDTFQSTSSLINSSHPKCDHLDWNGRVGAGLICNIRCSREPPHSDEVIVEESRRNDQIVIYMGSRLNFHFLCRFSNDECTNRIHILDTTEESRLVTSLPTKGKNCGKHFAASIEKSVDSLVKLAKLCPSFLKQLTAGGEKWLEMPAPFAGSTEGSPSKKPLAPGSPGAVIDSVEALVTWSPPSSLREVRQIIRRKLRE
ncbi:hypothetical protein B0H14DRAFT_2565205 [Mycena olivaceomarginata]|nr:hypothetical protein B0H14DRAFT_2565205 [Mycena olivaceomarginata]